MCKKSTRSQSVSSAAFFMGLYFAAIRWMEGVDNISGCESHIFLKFGIVFPPEFLMGFLSIRLMSFGPSVHDWIIKNSCVISHLMFEEYC